MEREINKRAQRVREYLSQLTEAERKQHDCLIKECLTREETLEGISASREEELSRLEDETALLERMTHLLSESSKEALRLSEYLLVRARILQLMIQKPVGTA